MQEPWFDARMGGWLGAFACTGTGTGTGTSSKRAFHCSFGARAAAEPASGRAGEEGEGGVMRCPYWMANSVR